MMRTLAFALAVAAALPAARAATYTRVLPESSVSFSATQMGVTMPGHFTRISAQVVFDPARPAMDRVAVTVQTASADAANAQTTALITGADWLDAAHHPQASFVSSRFTPAGPNRWWVDGTFSVKGHSAPLRVLATAHAQGADLALDADVKLARLHWGLGSGGWSDTSVVGAELPIHVHLLLAAH